MAFLFGKPIAVKSYMPFPVGKPIAVKSYMLFHVGKSFVLESYMPFSAGKSYLMESHMPFATREIVCDGVEDKVFRTERDSESFNSSFFQVKYPVCE